MYKVYLLLPQSTRKRCLWMLFRHWPRQKLETNHLFERLSLRGTNLWRTAFVLKFNIYAAWWAPSILDICQCYMCVCVCFIHTISVRILYVRTCRGGGWPCWPTHHCRRQFISSIGWCFATTGLSTLQYWCAFYVTFGPINHRIRYWNKTPRLWWWLMMMLVSHRFETMPHANNRFYPFFPFSFSRFLTLSFIHAFTHSRHVPIYEYCTKQIEMIPKNPTAAGTACACACVCVMWCHNTKVLSIHKNAFCCVINVFNVGKIGGSGSPLRWPYYVLITVCK